MSRSVKARLWRMQLRFRYLLWQRRRLSRLVLERGLGLPLVVLPGVFNPALFRTSDFVLDCLDQGLVRDGAQVLDLCTGTGVLALAVAERVARVVAVDLNPEAVRCARINVLLNKLEHRVEVREGDLFGPVAGERFDVVLCNPPYYSGSPTRVAELAFLAGDLPERLASGLEAHLTADGEAFVVLSSDAVETEFMSAFEAAGLAVEAVASRDLISEQVKLYRLGRRKLHE